MKIAFLTFFFLGCFSVYAQNIQWANEVLEVSSEYKPGMFFKGGLIHDHYPAKQALGKPNIVPHNSGDSPNAWVPQKPDETEFIKVGFLHPMKIKQIVIAESYNPSAVSDIYAYDLEGNEHLINTLSPSPIPTDGRLLNIIFNETEYQVKAIKIVLEGSAVPGFNAIDAIGISESSIPYKVQINVAGNLNGDLVLEKLSTNVNSPFMDLNPIVAPDGKVMYFSRNSPENTGGKWDREDIWYAERDEKTGEWKEAQNIGSPLNNDGSNFISSIALDGDNYILLLGNAYKKKNKMEAGVSLSRQTENGWSNPTPLNIRNFYNQAVHANYFLASNQKFILMSIQRADSEGGRDLYVSFPLEDSTWSEPLNLGTDINTAENESSPFLAMDDSTLFFSTRGFSGFGGDDVFMAKRLDNTWQHWSEPENLGPVINSKIDDTFFTISLTNEFAYLTRGSADSSDMYEMRLPIFKEPEIFYVIKGTVKDKETMEPLSANVLLTPLAEATPVTTQIHTNPKTGYFEISLPAGKYNIYPELKNYKSVDENVLALGEKKGKKTFNLDLYLTPDVAEEESFEVLVKQLKMLFPKEIAFTLNNSSFSVQKASEFERVKEFMDSHKNIGLEVVGYTCNLGAESYNQKLSEQRANTIASILIKMGVSSNRIKTVGKGESNPIASNDTEANRMKNRRVEFQLYELNK